MLKTSPVVIDGLGMTKEEAVAWPYGDQNIEIDSFASSFAEGTKESTISAGGMKATVREWIECLDRLSGASSDRRYHLRSQRRARKQRRGWA